MSGFNGFPGSVLRPLAKDIVDSLPEWKILCQQASLDVAFGDMENYIDEDSALGRRSATLTGFHTHLFEKFPLDILNDGAVISGIHHFNSSFATWFERHFP